MSKSTTNADVEICTEPKRSGSALTCERLRQLFRYNQETGVFTRVDAWKGKPAGRPVQSMCGGYIKVSIDGRRYYAHRLAWLFVTGEWPQQIIDHKNGDRTDNRFENLRLSTPSANRINQHVARSDSQTGLQGVRVRDGRYRAVIRVDGQKRYFGTYSTPLAAHEAAINAKRVHHPDFQG